MANHHRSDDSKGKLRRSLEERLKDHPDLIGRLEALADIVENAGDEVEKADEAERRVLEQVAMARCRDGPSGSSGKRLTTP